MGQKYALCLNYAIFWCFVGNRKFKVQVLQAAA